MKSCSFFLDHQFFGKRVDCIISELLGINRSQIKKRIMSDSLYIEGKLVNLSYKVKQSCYLKFSMTPEEKDAAEAPNLEIPVLYEDHNLVIVDKPRGINVHQGNGKRQFTIVDFLEYRYPGWKDHFEDKYRPGIVHRLDRDTSGVLLIARDQVSLLHLQKQFKNRTVSKEYHALVSPRLKQSSLEIAEPIKRHPVHRQKMAIASDGKESYTRIELIGHVKDYSYVKAFPRSGRTHQVRVHLKHAGHPLIGDKIYGVKNKISRKYPTFFLHAHNLKFMHPESGKWLDIKAPLPDYFSQMCLK